MPDQEDEHRRSELRKHKARATGLLLFATAAFIVVVITTDGSGWAGYAEAGAEAGAESGLGVMR